MSRKPSKPVPVAAPRNELRRLIRVAMMAAPKRPWTALMLTEAVRSLTPAFPTGQQIEDAIAWNHDQGFVSRKFDHELDLKTWLLTQDGISQQSA